MNKRQRVECAIRGGKPDKVPVSIYQHSAVHDRGVDEFVAYTLDFHSKFDPDYVKVMYDELYDTPVNYQFAVDASVWEQLQPLDPHKAAFGQVSRVAEENPQCCSGRYAGHRDNLFSFPYRCQVGVEKNP